MKNSKSKRELIRTLSEMKKHLSLMNEYYMTMRSEHPEISDSVEEVMFPDYKIEDHKCSCNECKENVRLIEAMSVRLDTLLIEKLKTSFMIEEFRS